MVQKLIKQIGRFKYIILVAVILIIIAFAAKGSVKYTSSFEINPSALSVYAIGSTGNLDWLTGKCTELDGTMWTNCEEPLNKYCLDYSGVSPTQCKRDLGCTDGPHSCDYFKTGTEGSINEITYSTQQTTETSDKSKTEVKFYSPMAGEIAADVTLCNPTGATIKGLTSLEVTTDLETKGARTGFTGVQYSCEHDEDVQMNFELAPGECTNKATLKAVGLAAGTYPVTVMTLDKCCIEGNCKELPPLYYGENIKTALTIQDSGIRCDGQYAEGKTFCLDDKIKKVCGNNGDWKPITCSEGYSCYSDTCRPNDQKSAVTQKPSLDMQSIKDYFKNLLPESLRPYSSMVLWLSILGIIIILAVVWTKEKKRGIYG